MPAQRSVRLLGLAALTLVVLATSIAFGAADLPLRAVLDALTGGGDETTRTIVIGLRLPRAVLALSLPRVLKRQKLSPTMISAPRQFVNLR